MKLAIGAILLAASTCAIAQDAANPVVTSAKEIVTRQGAWMIAAAEEMPADKYSFQPTPAQMSYGKIIAHVVGANYAVCGMLSGDGPAKVPTPVTETTPKDQLIAALKQSLDTCNKAVDGLTDSQLGATITFFGGAKKPRARALVELTIDLADHYGQMAASLRLNGLLPPSAKK